VLGEDLDAILDILQQEQAIYKRFSAVVSYPLSGLNFSGLSHCCFSSAKMR